MKVSPNLFRSDCFLRPYLSVNNSLGGSQIKKKGKELRSYFIRMFEPFGNGTVLAAFEHKLVYN